jgi:hypothetical protein
LTVFRRRREADDLDESADFEESNDVLADDERPTAPDHEPYAVTVPGRPTGPWDLEDAKDDGVDRLDLGGLHVPVPDGVELRVEVQDDVAMAVSLVDGNSLLQVHAFAAPKSSGLWDEVRTEIAQSLKGSGGTGEEAEGPFGTELRARLPMEDGQSQPARFFGVDGPRWFLRGLMTGAGSTDPNQARRLEEAFRQVAVNRGGDAMAPRDMIPLHLPREALEAQPEPEEEPDRTLRLPERGPEITEIQ